MEALILKHDAEQTEAQGQYHRRENEYEIQLHYTAEDHEDVDVSILKDDEGILIRENSPARQLYLSLSEQKEEGYLRTPLGMILFEAQLISVETNEEELMIHYMIEQNGVVDEKRFGVMKKDNASR